MLMSHLPRAAKLKYMPNGFRVISAGDHVLCARSGQAIPLEELRYWSVDAQEPYASAEISTEAFLGR